MSSSSKSSQERAASTLSTAAAAAASPPAATSCRQRSATLSRVASGAPARQSGEAPTNALRTEKSRVSSPARASVTQWAANRVAVADAKRGGGIAEGWGGLVTCLRGRTAKIRFWELRAGEDSLWTDRSPSANHKASPVEDGARRCTVYHLCYCTGLTTAHNRRSFDPPLMTGDIWEWIGCPHVQRDQEE
uniref:Uncharacterized protein n=1 Tax=Arundo donax TaxID=35708 RepID=A0A0A8YUE5_ARUDO